jgi:glycosyltransferase involved in cell wall biosynthesis
LQLESGNSGPIKLFWFSQTIGAQRGIENIISAIALVKAPVELHLLGNCTAEFKNALYTLADEKGLDNTKMQFHEPIPADDLFNFSSQFDIGIASETAYCLNNDIALSNKIFTYIQSGLAVLASDTKAQSLFVSQHPGTGRLYKKDDPENLADHINHYARNLDLLSLVKQENYRLGQTEINWETESEKFLHLINQILPG